jgi:hypothetical protein
MNQGNPCIPAFSKPCPNPSCGNEVIKIEKEEVTCCFTCHELFSWEKGREEPIRTKLIQDIDIPIEINPFYLTHVLDMDRTIYREVHRYAFLIRNNKRVVVEQYHTRTLQLEYIKYMMNGSSGAKDASLTSYKQFSKKIVQFYITRSTLEKE